MVPLPLPVAGSSGVWVAVWVMAGGRSFRTGPPLGQDRREGEWELARRLLAGTGKGLVRLPSTWPEGRLRWPLQLAQSLRHASLQAD